MKNHINIFFELARERYQILLKKKAGEPRPWTKDKIFDTYKFTNLFREEDATTVWMRKNVRDPLKKKPEVLLAVLVFRMFNRVSTGEAVFRQPDLFFDGTAFDHFLATRDIRVLRRAIKALCDNGPYVTGSYTVSSPPGLSKLDGVLQIIKEFDRGAVAWCGLGAGIYDTMNWDCDEGAAAYMLANRGDVTLEAAWEWLRRFKYIGQFHAYEIVTDLRHTALLDRAPDKLTWANPGPGAKRGLNRVFGREKTAKVSREQLIDEMRQLLSMSREERYWPQSWPAWELREAEMWTCEVDKYLRTKAGEGRPRGVYR